MLLLFHVVILSPSSLLPQLEVGGFRYMLNSYPVFMLKCKVIFFQSFNDVLEFFPLRLLKWLKDCLVFPFLASLC